jgi:hypothetical protein
LLHEVGSVAKVEWIWDHSTKPLAEDWLLRVLLIYLWEKPENFSKLPSAANSEFLLQ